MKVYWLNLTLAYIFDLSAVRLLQVWAEACISLQAIWEQTKIWTVWTMFGELKVQLRNES